MTSDQKKKLREDCELVLRLEARAGLSHIQPRFNARADIVLELLDENKRLRDALEFYADSDNWGHGPNKGIYYREMVDDSDLGDGSFMISETVDDNKVAGKHARQALRGVEEG